MTQRSTLRVLEQQAKGGTKTVHRLSLARKSRKPLHAITSQMKPLAAPIRLKPLQRRRATMKAASPAPEVKPLSSSSSSSSGDSGSDENADSADDDSQAAAAARIYAPKGARNVPLWLASNEEHAAAEAEGDKDEEEAASDVEVIEIFSPEEFGSPVAVHAAPDEESDDCIITGSFSPPKVEKSPPRRMKTPTFLKKKNRRSLRLAISPGQNRQAPGEEPKPIARVRRESRSKKRKNSVDAGDVWPALSSASSSGSSKTHAREAKMKPKPASRTQVPRDSLCIDATPIAVDGEVLPLNLPQQQQQKTAGDEKGETANLIDPLSISGSENEGEFASTTPTTTTTTTPTNTGYNGTSFQCPVGDI